MNISRAVFAILSTYSIATTASAAPGAYYNPATGNVVFYSDWCVENLSLISHSGKLTTASELLPLPGRVHDDSEFPFAYTYLIRGFQPPFAFNTGNTVVPGTPVSDLRFEYRLYHAGIHEGPITIVPEPAARLALLGGGVTLAIAALRRAQRMENADSGRGWRQVRRHDRGLTASVPPRC